MDRVDDLGDVFVVTCDAFLQLAQVFCQRFVCR